MSHVEALYFYREPDKEKEEHEDPREIVQLGEGDYALPKQNDSIKLRKFDSTTGNNFWMGGVVTRRDFYFSSGNQFKPVVNIYFMEIKNE